MEGRVLVVADEETALACRLAGFEAEVARDPDELLAKLEAGLARDDVSVILLAKELAEPVEAEVESIVRRARKIISYLPTPKSERKPVDMRRLLMKALGL